MPAKRALSAALALLLAVSFAAPSGARALSDAGFNYTVTDDVATVTGCTSTCPTTLVIPATLDIYPVTSIGDGAFNYTSMTAATIPDSVVSIGVGAFYGSSALATVTIGNSVTSIGSEAFRDSALTSVTIPNSVTTIDFAAFYDNALTTVTIGNSVTSIGQFAFGSNGLTSVTFLGNAPTGQGPAEGNVFDGNINLHSLFRPVDATGWGLSWSGLPAGASLTFIARANASADGATVTYTAAGTTVALDSTGQAGGGTITYSESDADCSISGSTLTVVQVGDGSCVVTATIAQSTNYLEATDTVTISINKASLTGLFIARANASADGATVTYTAAGTTVALDSTGQAGDGTITYTESDADCSISGSTLTVVQVGDGSCVVTATIAASDNYLEATDTVTITIRAAERATATVKPKVTGTAKVAKTLTAAKGTWTGYPTPAFTYQWYACTKAVSAASATVPATCKKITGATRSTFKLTSTQRGKYVAVYVKGTSLRTTATTWLSKTTTKVK